MTFSLTLAGERFAVRCRYPQTAEFCRGYTEEAETGPEGPASGCCEGGDPGPEGAGIGIAVTQAEIGRERLFALREAQLEGRAPQPFTEEELEPTAVYRQIADWFSYHGSAVAHGALVALHGEGYLFTAPSGTGKTTHVRNWLRCFPEAEVINGDKPVLRPEGDKLFGYGTPWSGKEGMNVNAAVPVKAIISLRRAAENRIRPLKWKEILPQLASAVYRPKDAEGMKRAMEFLIGLNGKVSFYELGCNMDPESARVAYEGINFREEHSGDQNL